MRLFTIYSILVGTRFQLNTIDYLDSARLRPGNMLQQFKHCLSWNTHRFDS